MKISTIE